MSVDKSGIRFPTENLESMPLERKRIVFLRWMLLAAEMSLLSDEMSGSLDNMASEIASWKLEQTACSDVELSLEEAGPRTSTPRASVSSDSDSPRQDSADDSFADSAAAIGNEPAEPNARIAPEYDAANDGKPIVLEKKKSTRESRRSTKTKGSGQMKALPRLRRAETP